ncbi:UDP-N-acetylmuramate--L-alanine ligase [Leptospira venezuelensis]|uniref:UDP-N-acetylmuramate--L-alanine ligase n=1 Tax=Leptospira venezuelensis TaxID=1958811 RepID=UPI000A3C8E68|nr:UDP-N-acetylmuramate--L-alanine ligase [Leptospira venezuelensis]
MENGSIQQRLGFSRPFFLGIGGSGMSSLAHILADAGLEVSGYDGKKSQVTENLEKKGVKIFSKLSDLEENIGYDSAIYSSAIRLDSHPIANFFKQKGIRFFHRSEVLHLCFEHLTCIAVGGSHGKTTTTAMTAHILNDLGYSPSVMVGGDVSFLNGVGGRFSPGKIGVFESDESDGTFLNHKAQVRILTNIDEDHLDFYHTREKLLEAFSKFISAGTHTVVLDMDDPGILDCLDLIQDKSKIFGFTSSLGSNAKSNGFKNLVHYKIENKKLIFFLDGKEFEITSRFPGKHYLTNSLAGVLAAYSLGADPEKASMSVSEYAGVKRRLEYIGNKDGVEIYDDYGHHPTEVQAVLSSIKELSGRDGRAVILFQPHRFTRTKNLYREFAKSLDAGDIVFLLPIYSAGEEPIPGITSELIANSMKTKPLLLSGDLKLDITFIRNTLKFGDRLITLGAGNVRDWGLAFMDSEEKK